MMNELANIMKSQRNDLLVFLRGSKVEKENLRNHKTDLFQHFTKI